MARFSGVQSTLISVESMPADSASESDVFEAYLFCTDVRNHQHKQFRCFWRLHTSGQATDRLVRYNALQQLRGTDGRPLHGTNSPKDRNCWMVSNVPLSPR